MSPIQLQNLLTTACVISACTLIALIPLAYMGIGCAYIGKVAGTALIVLLAAIVSK